MQMELYRSNSEDIPETIPEINNVVLENSHCHILLSRMFIDTLIDID